MVRIAYAWLARQGQIVVIHSERKHDGAVGVVHRRGYLDGTVPVLIPGVVPESQTFMADELEPVGSLKDYASREDDDG